MVDPRQKRRESVGDNDEEVQMTEASENSATSENSENLADLLAEARKKAAEMGFVFAHACRCR